MLLYTESFSCSLSFSCVPPCWFIWGVFRTYPVLVYIKSMLASWCREFFLYKTKRKNVKVNKNVHNWVTLLFNFKAEVDIQYRLHKVPSCLPAESVEINGSFSWKLVKTVTQRVKIQSVTFLMLLFGNERLTSVVYKTNGQGDRNLVNCALCYVIGQFKNAWTESAQWPIWLLPLVYTVS